MHSGEGRVSASRPRTRSGPLTLVACLLAALVAVIPLVAGGAGRVAAAPGQSSDQLLERYKKLGDEAEKTTEAMHNAKIEYDKQRDIVATARKAAADAQAKLDHSRAQLKDRQDRVDAIVRASYQGARVSGLYAVMVSDSPQALLDQMSGLDMIARQASADLTAVKKMRAQTESAKKDAEAKALTASEAVSRAERVRGELQAKQADLQMQAIKIRAMYQAMTGKQLAALRGQSFDFDPRLVPKGTAPALIAVNAALTRLGDPYVWGATGPHAFDCSGLMVWAYKQAGKTIPRSSQAQMAGGTPVSREDMKPGDLVIYYPDAHHVGMYIGEGYVIHASTFGVPVKIEPVDEAGPFNSARRF